MSNFTNSLILPALIIFDLDFTLWPYYVDSSVVIPFHRKPNGTIVDSAGKIIEYYPEVPQVFEAILSKGIKIGVTSRSFEPEADEQLIYFFGWEKYLSYKKLFYGPKIRHFRQIHKESKIAYSDMLFFDDEWRNIMDITEMGVLSILVDPNIEETGMTMDLLADGLRKYDEMRRDNSSSSVMPTIGI